MLEYTPAEVKRAVVGYGRADKRQVQQMIKLLLGLDKVPSPHDAADALAVAICHVHSGFEPGLRATGRAIQAATRGSKTTSSPGASTDLPSRCLVDCQLPRSDSRSPKPERGAMIAFLRGRVHRQAAEPDHRGRQWSWIRRARPALNLLRGR